MSSAKSKVLSVLFRKVAESTTAKGTIESASLTVDAVAKKKTQLPVLHSTINKFLEEVQSSGSLNRPLSIREGLQLHRKRVSKLSSHETNKPVRLLKDLISEGLEVEGSVVPGHEISAEKLPAESSAEKKTFSLDCCLDLLTQGTNRLAVGNKDSVDTFSIIAPITSTLRLDLSSHRCKEEHRQRKKRWVLKNTQNAKFDKLIKATASKIGPNLAIQYFRKLGRETGLKEYHSLISQCIETAKSVHDEKVKVEQIHHVFGFFYSMKEQGLLIEQQTYGPFLLFLIDMHATEEFYSCLEIIHDCDDAARLGYYEMLLAIEVNNETKVEEMCNIIAAQDRKSESTLRESYIMALCQRDRISELSRVMETMEIIQVSSLDYLSCIFQSLGRLALGSFAEKFILALKESDKWSDSVSVLLSDYVTSMMDLEAEEVTLRYLDLHAKLEVVPSCASYEKLIRFFCSLLKVYEALDIVDQMHKAGLFPTVKAFNLMLHACEDSCDYHLVQRIYSLLARCKEKPKCEVAEAYKSMIKLCIRMKDLNIAKSLLKDMEMLEIPPTATTYNAIIGCFYKEGNLYGVLKTFEEMELSGVEPNSQTFSYLIMMSETLDDVDKYLQKFKSSNVPATKHVFMALIHAYASCGQFDKAKEVIISNNIPIEDASDVKSALISVLSSHGKVDDALKVYEEMKKAGSNLAPSAVISLIEYSDSSVESSRLLCFMNDVKDPKYWIDACRRTIRCYVKDKNLRSAVLLLVELLSKVNDDNYAQVAINEIFAQVAEMDPPAVQFGFNLLNTIKDELNLQPPRRSLDFLLSACIAAKDLNIANLVWNQYQLAQLPYNVLSYLRMYQVYMACGDKNSAVKICKEIDRDDPHVRAVMNSFQFVYEPSSKKKGKAI